NELKSRKFFMTFTEEHIICLINLKKFTHPLSHTTNILPMIKIIIGLPQIKISFSVYIKKNYKPKINNCLKCFYIHIILLYRSKHQLKSYGWKEFVAIMRHSQNTHSALFILNYRMDKLVPLIFRKHCIHYSITNIQFFGKTI